LARCVTLWRRRSRRAIIANNAGLFRRGAAKPTPIPWGYNLRRIMREARTRGRHTVLRACARVRAHMCTSTAGLVFPRVWPTRTFVG